MLVWFTGADPNPRIYQTLRSLKTTRHTTEGRPAATNSAAAGNMTDTLLILGASARAAASSTIRAGLNPSAIDLFGDVDLRQSCRLTRCISDYPGEFPCVARELPPSAWMFTGGLENHTRIIDELSADRVLWGTPSRVISQVRDPWKLAECLRDAGLLYPDIAHVTSCAGPPAWATHVNRRWLRKPYRSAGGGKIDFWQAHRRSVADAAVDGSRGDPDATWYLQREVEGDSQSAVFVAAGGEAVLFGVTRQLVGAAWAGASGFRYTGSIGPLPLPAAVVANWCRIGECLAREFRLQGLFGVDAIANREGIWTIEVNPRYTSSIEILEFGLQRHAIAEHIAACRDGRLNRRLPESVGRFRGKAVMYASRDLQIDEAFVATARQSNDRQPWPVVADIPPVGQRIVAGHPVATLFVSSDSLADVEPRLQSVARTWRQRWSV